MGGAVPHNQQPTKFHTTLRCLALLALLKSVRYPVVNGILRKTMSLKGPNPAETHDDGMSTLLPTTFPATFLFCCVFAARFWTPNRNRPWEMEHGDNISSRGRG